MNISQLVNSMEPEFRTPVALAWHASDSPAEFEAELVSQSWDFPDLPVRSILDKFYHEMS